MASQARIYRGAWNYIEVLKPKESSLLVFIGVSSALVAAGGHAAPYPLLLVLLTVALGSLGANGLTNYLDRKVDARMKRTSHRPLPSGRIEPAEKALPLIIGSIGSALALAWILHPLAFLFGLIGVISSSLWRKQVTCVFQGSIASCVPVLVGYLAFASRLDWTVGLLCLLVAVWVPLHVWSIMIAYRDDYLQGGINYFPVSREPGDAIKVLPPLALLLYAVSLALWQVAGFGWLFFAVANALGLLMLIASLRLLISGASRDAWKVYKLSAYPYLGLLFLAMWLGFWV